MLRLFLICISLIGLTNSISAQKNKGLGGIEVVKAATQNTLGINAGYYVKFKNNTDKEVDGVKWKAYFYDNFETYKDKRDGKWQSGNFIIPVKPGLVFEDIEGVWVEGGTKVFVRITEVHFTDGSSAKAGSYN
ncbi:MAG: hypothetical protein ACK5CY_08470 [Bacteroidia bacterium]|jgi:hypothetical protein